MPKSASCRARHTGEVSFPGDAGVLFTQINVPAYELLGTKN